MSRSLVQPLLRIVVVVAAAAAVTSPELLEGVSAVLVSAALFAVAGIVWILSG